MEVNKPYFEPYIGKDYWETSPRILVIGDSHYCGECDLCGIRGNLSMEEMKSCENLTTKTVCDYLSSRKTEKELDVWMRKTYLPFDKIFYGKENIDFSESQILWNKIAFYNFVQTAASSDPSNTNYTNSEYLQSNPRAWKVIYSLKPNLIIVWGRRVYNKLNGENWYKINSYSGIFELSDGQRIFCLKIWHPSRANRETWHKAIKEILNMMKN